ncbi:chemotaxis protein CheW [bacterium]|nr:chemotaxis protein CheW [bacterium]
MNRLEELRRQFDEGFRYPPRDGEREIRDRLLLQSGSRWLSLPLNQVTEVLRCPLMTPLPGAPPGLLGLVGLRGTLLPVYALTDLLGQPSSLAGGGAMWILVVPQPEMVGLALEASSVSLTAQAEQSQEIDLFALVEELQRRFVHE